MPTACNMSVCFLWRQHFFSLSCCSRLLTFNSVHLLVPLPKLTRDKKRESYRGYENTCRKNCFFAFTTFPFAWLFTFCLRIISLYNKRKNQNVISFRKLVKLPCLSWAVLFRRRNKVHDEVKKSSNYYKDVSLYFTNLKINLVITWFIRT